MYMQTCNLFRGKKKISSPFKKTKACQQSNSMVARETKTLFKVFEVSLKHVKTIFKKQNPQYRHSLVVLFRLYLRTLKKINKSSNENHYYNWLIQKMVSCLYCLGVFQCRLQVGLDLGLVYLDLKEEKNRKKLKQKTNKQKHPIILRYTHAWSS